MATKTLNQEWTVSSNGKYIFLAKSGGYEIELSRIRNERDVLAWVLHLSEKAWITKDDLRGFIKKLAEVKKLSVFGL